MWVIDFEYRFNMKDKILADAARIATSPPIIGQQAIVCGVSTWEN